MSVDTYAVNTVWLSVITYHGSRITSHHAMVNITNTLVRRLGPALLVVNNTVWLFGIVRQYALPEPYLGTMGQ